MTSDAASSSDEDRQRRDPSFNDSMMQHLELKGTFRGAPDSFFSFWGGSSPSALAQGLLLVCGAVVVCGVSSVVYWVGRSRERLDVLHATAGAGTAFVVLVLAIASFVGLTRARRRRNDEREALRVWSDEHRAPPGASSTRGDG